MQNARRRVSLSSKGQLVIPKDIRKSMDISKGDEFLLEMVEEGVLMRPASKDKQRPKQRFRGMLKGENMDPDECEEILEEARKSLVSSSPDL